MMEKLCVSNDACAYVYADDIARALCSVISPPVTERPAPLSTGLRKFETWDRTTIESGIG